MRHVRFRIAKNLKDLEGGRRREKDKGRKGGGKSLFQWSSIVLGSWRILDLCGGCYRTEIPWTQGYFGVREFRGVTGEHLGPIKCHGKLCGRRSVRLR